MSKADGVNVGNGDYLIEEAPVVFQATLAAALGVNEAILCQQVFWLTRNSYDKRFRLRQYDGRIWVQIKPQDILDPIQGHLRFMSLRTFRRTTTDLQAKGILLTAQWPTYGLAKWYSIDREALAAAVAEYSANRDKEVLETLLAGNVCQNGTVICATNLDGDDVCQNDTANGDNLTRVSVPKLSQTDAKMAQSYPYNKKKEIRKEANRASDLCQNDTQTGKSTDENGLLDAEIDALPDAQRQSIYDEAEVRMGIMGRVGSFPEGLKAMRRVVYREMLANRGLD